MLREYEFTFISRHDLPETERNEHFDKYEKLLLADGGEVIKRDDWGIKKLSYPINKHYRGHYLHYDIKANPTSLSEVERLMRIDDNVLRFLSVRIADEVKDVGARKAELEKYAEKVAASRKKERK